jgi:hypothetical protein
MKTETAHKVFSATAWLFLILSGLLFLVPTAGVTGQAAAWVCLGVGIASHVILLGAIVFEVFQGKPDVPPTGG